MSPAIPQPPRLRYTPGRSRTPKPGPGPGPQPPERDNLLSDENYSFEGGTTGDWVGEGCALANTAVHARFGAHALEVTKTGEDGEMAANLLGYPASPGDLFVLQASFLPAEEPKPATAGLRWRDSDGNLLQSDHDVGFSEVAEGWADQSQTLIAPMGTATLDVLLFWFYGRPVGEIHYADGIVLRQVAVDPQQHEALRVMLSIAHR